MKLSNSALPTRSATGRQPFRSRLTAADFFSRVDVGSLGHCALIDLVRAVRTSREAHILYHKKQGDKVTDIADALGLTRHQVSYSWQQLLDRARKDRFLYAKEDAA